MIKFVIYQDLRGEWRWRLVANNGRVMADSSEGYVDRNNAEIALSSIVSHITTEQFSVDYQ